MTGAGGGARDHDPVPFGVYVHVPFCARRCDYCDFATWSDRGHLLDEYVDACVTDLRRRVAGGLPPATSVFFGGGTPSLLPAASLLRILDEIPRRDGAEVTVECNPDAVDPAGLAAYRRGGVNRLSFGVQSLRRHVLAGLGRTHDPDGVVRAVGWARDAGFEALNLDLIYGGPGETADDWRASLEGALALDPPHLSAYALTVEPGTPLGRRVAAGEQAGPDDDTLADRYLAADRLLTEAGLEWYEISNWARPGSECRHHLLYWDQGDYVGIGCAAHGHEDGRRWWNVRTPERYVGRVAEGRSPEAGHERLDPAARSEERFALALRTRAGARVSASAEPVVSDLAGSGLLDRDGDQVRLTVRGRLLATEVTARLLLAGAATQPSPAGTR